MERIEKVIKGLECCKWSDAGRYDGYEPMYENCEKCPYNNEQDSKSECNDKLRQDVLSLLKELLKEQRPIKPVCFEHRRTRNKYQCGNCGSSEVFKELEYCPWCGMELKWDE